MFRTRFPRILASKLLMAGITLCSAFSTAMMAQSGLNMPLQSYCSGYGKEVSDILWGSEANAHLSAAVRLDKAMLQGTSIVALKFFMAAAPKMRDCQIFLTKSLNSAGRIYEQEFTPAQGWNYVWLDYPFALDGIETIYIGYETTCAGEVIGAAATQSTSDEADLVKNGNGAWQSLSVLRKQPCELALSAILTGGDYSDYTQTGITFIPDVAPQLVKANEPFLITGTAINTGVNTLDNPTWEYSIDGEAVAASGTIETTLINYATATVSVPVEVASGKHCIKVALKDIHGNISQSDFYVDAYDRAYPKLPLVELFTSQYCSNCPEGDATLERALTRAGVEAVHISHHSGFTPDYFTIPESEALADAFGAGSAPLMMLDRTPVNIGGSPLLIYNPGYSTPAHFQHFVKANTLAGIKTHATWHIPDEMLRITVTVEKDASFEHDMLYLNAAICEDNVDGFQADKGTTHNTYSHNHMPRVILTQVPSGNPVEFDGNGNAVFEFTTPLPEVKNGFTGDAASPSIENLNIVAFVASHDTAGKNYAVVNSASSPVEISEESSMETPAADNHRNQPFAIIDGNTVRISGAHYALVYEVCGRQIATIENGAATILPGGIYILRADNGNIMKIVI